MRVVKQYYTYKAEQMIKISSVAKESHDEIINGINIMAGKINNSKKKINGVKTIKANLVTYLRDNCSWETEHNIDVLKGKNRDIDLFKKYIVNEYEFCVGLEFETGNVASVHRSLNKLSIGLQSRELDLIILLLPVRNLAQYLTDRVANYEEIEAYFPIFSEKPFIALGFDADEYSADFPILKKGKDGNASKASSN